MTKRAIKNIEKSIRSRLFNLAGHQQLSYQMLIIRYAHERLLYRLSRSIYRERFYLKGGVLLYAFDRDNARPTVDIDFSGNRIGNDIAQIKSVFTEICKINDAPDGIRFDMDEIQAAEINENRVYKGIRLIITARMDTIIQPLNVDIGFGDIVVPYANELDYPLLLPDLPIPRILAYSPETVIAEKFQAMIELSETNSRMKDFYDVYRMLKKGDFDSENLELAINATFDTRFTRYTDDHPIFTDDFAENKTKQVQWSAFLKKISPNDEVPERFEDVAAFIVKELYAYWLKRKEE